ncbi:ABC transporter substrate-binding protein [Roseomonas sp. PWR1]|uniref:ABC transporter substrate-binding protein n=1 Tax=Roseomonas nitratireducens TaxID=2820810 RepID=A0ABS4ARK2_9PROT|nr:ABC transporter substrate-binding protein [Neoroseomonas nitratireducens]MBP0463483.1 ABC transporter substrate-binding protein [Neoroseomonas nitratireducens]
MIARRALPLIALPGLAHAQARPRRIALIVSSAEGDPDANGRAAALREGLRALGWIEGRNIEIVHRWGAGDLARAEAHAQEMVALAPDIIVSNGTPQLAALQRHNRAIPVVFVVVVDPVGAGFVRSMARPGGHVTGFATYEPELGGKWLDLLREFDPAMRRVAIVNDPDFRGFAGLARHVHERAAAIGLASVDIHFRRPEQPVEALLAEAAAGGDTGIIAMPTALNLLARARLIDAARETRMPAIYPFRPFVDSGGLMSYGFEPLDLFRRSAAYVDRILRGEAPGDLPVQLPTRFEFFVNRRTARALGRDFPDLLLARADEVIE